MVQVPPLSKFNYSMEFLGDTHGDFTDLKINKYSYIRFQNKWYFTSQTSMMNMY